ncbi:putative NAD(P)-binding domain-containing protein [Seiridium unicorne]|uniref:NAD(P)-binding domain-containing protein n=1 Tax=Seiridium unicorne TaxID=138068 RepID=A0ABR2V9A1_9PEZI
MEPGPGYLPTGTELMYLVIRLEDLRELGDIIKVFKKYGEIARGLVLLCVEPQLGIYERIGFAGTLRSGDGPLASQEALLSTLFLPGKIIDSSCKYSYARKRSYFVFFPNSKPIQPPRYGKAYSTTWTQLKTAFEAPISSPAHSAKKQNIPGLHVLQGGARLVTAALDILQTENGWKKPRLIFLSSATWNPRFAAATPAPMLCIVRTAFCHPCADLLAAQAKFTAKPHLLSLLFVQPPAIVEDDATGHEISTESVRLAVSYADLGAAFAELALERSYDKLGAVGVSSQGGDAFGKYGLELASRMVVGLLAGYVPGYWSLAALLKNWC